MDINFEDFKQYLVTKKHLSSNTLVTRFSRFRIFTNWLSDKPLTTQSIEAFFYNLQQQGLRNSSLNTYIATLYSLRDYTVDRGLSDDFMKGFEKYKEDEVHIDPLTKEEVEKLLSTESICKRSSHLTRCYKALTLFLTLTGTRWEDAQNLRVSSVDISGKKVTYTQLKNRKLRHVYVSDILVDQLKACINGRKLNDYVFVNSAGSSIIYGEYHRYLKNLARKAGITKRVSPHILRHSYSQVFYDETRDIYLLKNVIGHSSITSTERYVRNSQKVIQEAQLLHPYLENSMTPTILIEKIHNQLREHHLENDNRFNYNKVSQLISEFVSGLYQSVESKTHS